MRNVLSEVMEKVMGISNENNFAIVGLFILIGFIINNVAGNRNYIVKTVMLIY